MTDQQLGFAHAQRLQQSYPFISDLRLDRILKHARTGLEW